MLESFVTDSAIRTRVAEDMKSAMRAQQKDRLGTIRLILSEFKRIEVDERITLDDVRSLAVLDKMIKQRRDSIQQFTAAGRQELADKEAAEIAVIREYMPARLGEAEILSLIAEAIAQSGAKSGQDMGKVMGILKPQLQGKADMGEVSKLVKSRLG
jgi:uncharacterized protein YqeY